MKQRFPYSDAVPAPRLPHRSHPPVWRKPNWMVPIVTAALNATAIIFVAYFGSGTAAATDQTTESTVAGQTVERVLPGVALSSGTTIPEGETMTVVCSGDGEALLHVVKSSGAGLDEILGLCDG